MAEINEQFLAICRERVRLDDCYASERMRLVTQMRELLNCTKGRKRPGKFKVKNSRGICLVYV